MLLYSADIENIASVLNLVQNIYLSEVILYFFTFLFCKFISQVRITDRIHTEGRTDTGQRDRYIDTFTCFEKDVYFLFFSFLIILFKIQKTNSIQLKAFKSLFVCILFIFCELCYAQIKK